MRYRLPLSAGEVEIEAEEVWGGCAGGRPEYHLAGGFTVLAPKGEPLERVEPPLCGRDEGFSWAEVCAHGAPVRLVPDPFAEPVALPWKRHGIEVQQTIGDKVEGPGRHVHVSTKNASYGFAHVKPEVAREMARALMTAADAAEKEQS